MRHINQRNVTQGLRCDVGQPYTHHSQQRSGRVFVRARLVLGLLCVLGCAERKTVTAPGAIHDPTQIYSRLELSYHAITLSLVAGLDTMTLSTTARTPTGAALIDFDSANSPVTYRSATNDPAIRVMADGQLIAQRVTARSLVIATQKIGSVTLSDTAVVVITNTAAPSPAIATISLQPLPGDSAKVDCSGLHTDTISARLLDGAGQPVVTTALASYRSSNAMIATISSTGLLEGKKTGTVTITTDAYVYGRGVRDSIRYTIGEPLIQIIWMLSRNLIGNSTPASYAGPSDVTIGVGGRVSWMNASAERIDIIFEDTAAARPSVGGEGAIIVATGAKVLSNFNACAPQGGGNIPFLSTAEPFILNGVHYTTSITCANAGSRMFNRVGTYTYRSSVTGITGRIIVR